MDYNHIVRRYFYLYRDDKLGERKQKVSDTVAARRSTAEKMDNC